MKNPNFKKRRINKLIKKENNNTIFLEAQHYNQHHEDSQYHTWKLHTS